MSFRDRKVWTENFVLVGLSHLPKQKLGTPVTRITELHSLHCLQDIVTVKRPQALDEFSKMRSVTS